MYDMMTCGGLGTSVLGPCSLSWFAFAIVLMLGLVLRRQCQDGIFSGTGYNAIAALGLGLVLTYLTVSLTGEPRWGLLAGFVGLAVGGFLIGMWIDTAGGAEI